MANSTEAARPNRDLIGFITTHFSRMPRWQKITIVALLALTTLATVAGLIITFTHVMIPFCFWTLLIGSALVTARRIFSSEDRALAEQFNLANILHEIKSKTMPVLGTSAALTALTILFPMVMIPAYLTSATIIGVAAFWLHPSHAN
ncbi:MAG: hypothetical protein HZB76_07045 [Chlamydiae bacterium]|nr:hypothetical protein [Chlamydiota bacterium]